MGSKTFGSKELDWKPTQLALFIEARWHMMGRGLQTFALLYLHCEISGQTIQDTYSIIIWTTLIVNNKIEKCYFRSVAFMKVGVFEFQIHFTFLKWKLAPVVYMLLEYG